MNRNDLENILNDDTLSNEQVRCIITTYCIINKIEVDTMRWDKLIYWLFDNYYDYFEYDKLDEFMCEYLV